MGYKSRKYQAPFHSSASISVGNVPAFLIYLYSPRTLQLYCFNRQWRRTRRMVYYLFLHNLQYYLQLHSHPLPEASFSIPRFIIAISPLGEVCFWTACTICNRIFFIKPNGRKPSSDGFNSVYQIYIPSLLLDNFEDV